MSKTDSVRAFFALLPDGAARAALGAVASALPPEAGCPVMPTNLHLTLAFVGDSDAVRLACLHARAATVPMSPLNIRLSRLGGFRRGRVWWLGPNRSLADLRALVSRLASALSPCGFEPERRPFRAHVTLSRGARAEPEGVHMMPIEWVASDFVLMASRQTAEGVCYEVLARYPSDVDAPLSAGLSVG